MKILTGQKTFKCLPPLNLATCTKEDIKEYFNNSYDLNESLFLALKDESVFYVYPDKLRLPLIFYYAHTAVVFINKLILAGLLRKRINLEYETMFETGVNELAWDDTENYRLGGRLQWPCLADVVKYRIEARELILKVIEDTELHLPITMDSPWWAVMMGIEHERVHVETSSVLIRQLPVDMVSKPDGWKYGPLNAGEPVVKNKMLAQNETTVVEIGKPSNHPSYGWDIDYGHDSWSVPPFEANQFPMTNREFLEFVKDGGYSQQALWTHEGWTWRESAETKHPVFWVCRAGCKSNGGGSLSEYSHCGKTSSLNDSLACQSKPGGAYKLRLMFDEVDLPLDWPVEVNYHEAKAFCNWKGPGFRLPTEAEYQVMRGQQTKSASGIILDPIFQAKIPANLNLQYGSSTPVNLFPPSPSGFYDAMGNTWEWTEDHLNGLNGFHSHHLYDDYSTTYFDGKHNMFLGGSWISNGTFGSKFIRNFFRRHFFQHGGFRMARSLPDDDRHTVEIPASFVDTEAYVVGTGVEETEFQLPDQLTPRHVISKNPVYLYDTEMQLEKSLIEDFELVNSFPIMAARYCDAYAARNGVTRDSALHLGACTGRVTFELSRSFQQVLGVEVCGRQFETAVRLKSGRKDRLCERAKNITLDNSYNLSRIVLKQLSWVPNEVGFHDLVLLTHLERVHNPKAWMMRLWEVVRREGIVVVACRAGIWTKDRLQEHLQDGLRCVDSQEFAYEDVEGVKRAAISVWKY